MSAVLGLLIDEREKSEVVYLLKRELEEILFDLGDSRIDTVVKTAMRKRYQTLFQLFQRVANEQECMQYMLKGTEYKE